MEQDVFVDLLFLINFSMDYLCLYLCAKIMKKRMRPWRMIIAAAIGGIYSVFSLFIPFSSWIALTIDALVCVIICAVAFAEEERKLSSTMLCSFLFVGISMMTGGCMTAIFNLLNRLDLPIDGIEADGISTYLFAIIAAAAGIISLRHGQLISRRSGVGECILKLTLGGREITLRALSDSGNLVRDPLSGKNIVIVDKTKLSSITDVSFFEKYAQGDTSNNNLRGMRVIPINTAGGRHLLCACIPDKLTASLPDKKGRERRIELDALIAPSDIKRGAEGFGAIIPEELLKI